MQAQKTVRNHLCSELVSVVPLSGRSRRRVLDGNLEEIGERSALILVQNPLHNGERVRVTAKGHELIGRVKSCTIDRLLGFFVDIELDQDSLWSEKWFVPQHLFKLCPSLRYFTQPAPQEPEEIFPHRANKSAHRNLPTHSST